MGSPLHNAVVVKRLHPEEEIERISAEAPAADMAKRDGIERGVFRSEKERGARQQRACE